MDADWGPRRPLRKYAVSSQVKAVRLPTTSRRKIPFLQRTPNGGATLSPDECIALGVPICERRVQGGMRDQSAHGACGWREYIGTSIRQFHSLSRQGRGGRMGPFRPSSLNAK